MEWLNDNEIDKQKFKVLRLYAPEVEEKSIQYG